MASSLLKQSLLSRALRKATVLVYKGLAPFRTHAQGLHQIFPAFEGQRGEQQQLIRLLIVVPFRDKVELTRTCLQGLLQQERVGLELCIALVDNNSVEPATAAWLQQLNASPCAGITLRCLSYSTPFNFSYLNNQAVHDCADFQADVVAFINNDIEFTEPRTLVTLARLSAGSPAAGAVGCTLLFPNRRIQHLFVYVGSKIVGSHPWRGRRLNAEHPWFSAVRVVPGVTGAVLFMRHHDFIAVDGFDEKLATSYQDVDLCLKLQQMGRVNLTVPYIINIHHETQTRSKAPNFEEATYAYTKWGDFLGQNPSVPRIYSRLAEDLVPGFAWSDRLLSFFSHPS